MVFSVRKVVNQLLLWMHFVVVFKLHKGIKFSIDHLLSLFPPVD